MTLAEVLKFGWPITRREWQQDLIRLYLQDHDELVIEHVGNMRESHRFVFNNGDMIATDWEIYYAEGRGFYS